VAHIDRKLSPLHFTGGGSLFLEVYSPKQILKANMSAREK
jgi:hypothetical protein